MSERCHETGKNGYATFTQAQRAIKALLRHKRGASADPLHELRAYVCQYCQRWHIGHINKGDRE